MVRVGDDLAHRAIFAIVTVVRGRASPASPASPATAIFTRWTCG